MKVRLSRAVVGSLMLIGSLTIAINSVSEGPVRAAAMVTAPASLTLNPNTADQNVDDFVISGFGADDQLLVSIGFVNPPVGTTFTLPLRTGLTLNGYSVWSNLTRVSFTGTMQAANAALAAMTVSTGASTGSVTIRVSATSAQTGYTYNPLNDSFYLFVSGNVTWTTAKTNAENYSYKGATGYLVTITSQDEQDFVNNNIPNASNLWIGASDAASEGVWKWETGPEAGTQFWQGAANGTRVENRYEDWCRGSEPNNAGAGEHYAVTKWNGPCWNDLPNSFGSIQGYVVEFSPPVGGYSEFASAQSTAVVNYAATDVAAEPGNGQAKVTWSAPSNGTVQSYAVSTTPAGGSCTPSPVTARECLVRGLADGTTYTFTVATTFTNNETVASSPSAPWTSTNSRPTISGPSTVTASNNVPTPIGTFSIADPNSCGWTSVTATASTSSGTLAAVASGGATVSGSGTNTVRVTGTRAAVGTVLSAMTLTASAGSSPTVATSVVPAITFTNPNDNRTYHFNPSNGHYYWIDRVTPKTVTTARSERTLGSSNKFCGSFGYLATIIDPDEQAFIEAEALGTAGGNTSLWTSGYRDGATCGASCTGGTWKWLPGPFAPLGEDGSTLYNTTGGGPWQTGEPNNSGPQHHLWFTNGRYGWDDVGGTGSQGVLVEFGSITSFTPSSVSTSVTVVAAPSSAPTITSITTTQSTLSVNFTAPIDDGGSTITNYAYSTDNGSTWTDLDPASTASPILISGLADSTSYQVMIRAFNGLDGAASTPVSASTRPPQGVIASPNLATISTTSYTDVFTGPPLTNFTGTIRALVTVSNATVRLSTITGLSEVIGYNQSLTDGTATEIAFSGTVAQVNAALDSLSVRGSAAGAASLDVSVSSGGAAFDPSTGRYYEFVSTAVSWGEARCRAKYTNATFDGSTNGSGVNGDDCNSNDGQPLTRRTYDGMTGYLASVTSEAENNFVLSKVGTSTAWLGGTDLAVEGNWKWVDGPENGQTFWIQGTTTTRCGTNLISGVARYNCWNFGEPNDAGGEDALEMLVGGSGQWNDLSTTQHTRGYIIEYGLDGEFGAGQAQLSLALSVLNHLEPRQVQVIPGDGSVLVGFAAPIDAFNGESITEYTVTSDPEGRTCAASTVDLFCTVTGLTNGTAYTFAVVANSATFGSGRASPPTVAVKPGVPFSQVPPSITGTIRVGSTLTVVDPDGNWVNPRNNDMTPSYQWRADGQSIAGATGPTLLITASLAGKVVTVIGSRTNDIGTGSAISGAIAVVPSVYLTDMQVSPGVLGPNFSPSTLTYSLTVPAGTREMSLTAVASAGTLQIDGETAQSGTASLLELQTGENIFLITVTQGSVSLTYELTVIVPVLIFFVPPSAEPPAVGPPAPVLAPRPIDPSDPIPTTPVFLVTGELPSVPVGEGFATEDGRLVEVVIEEVGPAKWTISGEDFILGLEVDSPTARNFDSQGNIIFVRNEVVRVEGDGFLAGTSVDVWLFSEPVFVGTVTVGPDGSFLGELAVPLAIRSGTHTLQVNGLTADGNLRSLNLGVRVADSAQQLPSTGGGSAFPMILAWWMLVAGLFVMAARRQWAA